MEENELIQKIVRFDIYCDTCKFKDVPETDDPCNECLTMPARTDGSRKPINYKMKEYVR